MRHRKRKWAAAATIATSPAALVVALLRIVRHFETAALAAADIAAATPATPATGATGVARCLRRVVAHRQACAAATGQLRDIGNAETATTRSPVHVRHRQAHAAENVAERTLHVFGQATHGHTGDHGQHAADDGAVDASCARCPVSDAAARVLAANEMVENGVAVRHSTRVFVQGRITEIRAMVALTERLDEIGEAAARQRVAFDRTGQFGQHGRDDGTGLRGRDAIGLAEFGEGLPALRLLECVEYGHDLSPAR